MKKSISLLIAFSMVSVAGCTSVKSHVSPKGAVIDSGTWQAQFISEYDAFVSSDEFVRTGDPEKLVRDVEFYSLSETNMVTTETSVSGKTIKTTRNTTEEYTYSYDYGRELFQTVGEGKTKVKSNVSEEYGYDKEDTVYSVNRFYDNVNLTYTISPMPIKVYEAFANECSGFYTEAEGWYSMVKNGTFASSDTKCYKNGHIYTLYMEMNMADIGYFKDAVGTVISVYQFKFDRKSVSISALEEAKGVAYTDSTGAKVKANGTSGTFKKLSFKDVTINYPNEARYALM